MSDPKYLSNSSLCLQVKNSAAPSWKLMKNTEAILNFYHFSYILFLTLVSACKLFQTLHANKINLISIYRTAWLFCLFDYHGSYSYFSLCLLLLPCNDYSVFDLFLFDSLFISYFFWTRLKLPLYSRCLFSLVLIIWKIVVSFSFGDFE